MKVRMYRELVEINTTRWGRARLPNAPVFAACADDTITAIRENGP